MPRSSSLPRALGISAGAILPALAASGAAANQPPDALLAEMTVIATRLEQDVYSVPYTTHVLRRDEFFGRRAVRTLTDALGDVPGVMLQKTSYGQCSPFIRGFTGFRTLLLVDGIRLNNAVFREGPNQYWSTVDAHAVDRIEIVKGPSSVLHGSDAIGGTVNASTPTSFIPAASATMGALDWAEPVPGAPVAAGLFHRYASAENSHVARFDLAAAPVETLQLRGGITYKDFDDLRAGGGTGLQPGSGYRERNGDFKLILQPRRDLRVIAAYQRTEQLDVPRTHATVHGKSFAGTAVGTDLRRDLDQTRDLAYVQANLRKPAPWLTSARVSFSWHRQAEEQDRIRSNQRREITGFSDDQLGLLLHLAGASPLGSLNYGVEYYYDDVSSYGIDIAANGTVRRLPRGPVADDARYQLLGVYLQDQIAITSRVEATLGIRYSRTHARAADIDPDPTDAVIFGPLDRSANAVTASARARFDASPTWNVFGGISQGFRAPNLSDYTSFELARSGERETPAPNLRDERYVSFELGTKVRVPQLDAEIYLAGFHTLIDGQITRFPTGRLVQGDREVTKANSGEGYTQGVELGSVIRLGRGWSISGGLTWARGELEQYATNALETRPASRIQPLTGHVAALWRSGDARFWFEAAGRAAGRQDRLAPGDIADNQRIPPGGTPGYEMFSLRGGWRVHPRMSLSLAAENLFDRDYRIHGSGINEPGFNLVTSIRTVF